MYEPSRVHLLTGAGDSNYSAVGGPTTDDINRLFGGDSSLGQDAVDAVANAHAYMIDKAPQRQGCDELYDALSQVTNQQLQSDGTFQNALRLLQQGQRDAALNLLASIDPFNTLMQAGQSVQITRVTNEGFVKYRGSAKVIVDFGGNWDAFKRYTANEPVPEGAKIYGKVSDVFEPRILYAGASLNIEQFEISGYTQRANVSATGEVTPSGERRRVTGTGTAVSVTPQIAAGYSVAKEPVITVLHCNFGVRKYEIDVGQVPFGAGTRNVTVERNGWYIGVWGIETQTPGRPRDRKFFRYHQRHGIGFIGDPTNLNVFGYWTMEINPPGLRGQQTQIRIMPTLLAERILEQYRVGGEITPEFMQKLGRDASVSAGLPVKMKVNTETGVKTWEFGGRLKVQPIRGLAITGDLGYITDEGGRDRWQRRPGVMQVGAGIEVTLPELWQSRPKPIDSVPQKKKSKPRQTSKRSEELYKKATRFLALGSSAAGSRQAKQMAKDLEAALRSDKALYSDASFRKTSSYRHAMQQLKRGKLKEGLAALNRLSYFRSLKG